MSDHKLQMTEEQFCQLMKQMFHNAFMPLIDEHIKLEVNEQLKRLTATLVAGLIRK